MAFIVLLVAVWIPCACFCGVIAEDKGHGGITWFWAGLLFGPLGLLAVAALSDRKQRRYLRLLVEDKGIDLTEAKAPSANDKAKEILKQRRGY